MEDLVAQARIDGEPVVDLEVVLHERALLDDPEVRDLEQESPARVVEVPEEHRGEAGAAGIGDRIVDEAGAEIDGAPRVVVNPRRRPAIDEPIPELQLVAALQPDQPVFDLIVELAGIHGQERRPSRQAGEVGDADVRQPGRDLVDVDAVDSQRFRGVVAVVRLLRERLGLGIADAELVDQLRLEHLRVVERHAVRRQARVLDAGDERAEVEARGGLRRRRQAAVRLALRRVEAVLAVVEPHEERVVVRKLVIDAARERVIGDLRDRGRDVIVEAAASGVRAADRRWRCCGRPG